MYCIFVVILSAIVTFGTAAEEEKAFDTSKVREIRVSYSVHFTQLSITANKDKITYMLHLQGPGEAYKIQSGAKALESMAAILSNTALFIKDQYKFDDDPQSNPAYAIEVVLNNGETITRRIRYHDLYHVKGTEFVGGVDTELIAGWIASFTSAEKEKWVKDGEWHLKPVKTDFTKDDF